MSQAVFRLFVSSPGDVAAERARAEAVVEKLNAEFRDRARFDPEFWEDHFYSAHETFQRQIPEAAGFDLVVAIFRARLGSALPDDFKRQPDGEAYPSGTAYEVLSAIAKRRETQTPDIYVFRYPKAPEVSLDDPKRTDVEEQWHALEGFFQRWFRTPGGEFIAAFQPYASADDFAERIEACLRQWLANRGISARETWDRERLGSPFPGLAPFEADRERVFFGRDLAIRQAVERLREAKTPFLLILGASGAGKSSLLRAGLMPTLARPGAIPEVDCFRFALIAPGLDPFAELAVALLAPEALVAELTGGRFADKTVLIQALKGDPATAAAVLGGALDKAAEARRTQAHFDTPRPARLILAVDQAERLFAEAPKEADAFGALLQALAGPVAYIVMVMRSDAYPRFQACAPLLALRGAGATFDLIPPTAAELEDIVERPVAACEPKLAFGESDPPFPERLVADARGGDALPLLQMTLEGLYKAEEARGDGVLKAEDYRGMAAAVSEVASAAMAHLGASGKQALEALVAGLVTDIAPDPVTAEPAPVVAALDRDAFVRGRPERAALLQAFVEARLLTLDGGSRVRPTHDALLRIWPEAAALVKAMASLIRARHALVPLAQAWAEAPQVEKSRHLELSAPLLAAGDELRKQLGEDLGEPLLAFIAAAMDAAEAERLSKRRAERRLLGAAIAAFLVMTGLAVAAALQWREAATQRTAAVQSKNDALAQKAAAEGAKNDAVAQKALAEQARNEALAQKATAERNLGLATDAANSLVMDVAFKFRELSGVPTSMIKSILDSALNLEQKLLDSGQSSPALLRNQLAALIQTSETLRSLGDTSGALDAARKSVGVAERALRQAPEDTAWQGFLAISNSEVGDAEVAQGQLGPALDSFRAQFAIVDRLAKSDPGNVAWQLGLAGAHDKIGDAEIAQGQLAAGLDAFRSESAILDRLLKSDPGNLGLQRGLAASGEKIGNVELAQGQLSQALKSYQAEFDILDRLAKSEPNNAALQRSLSVAHEKVGTVQLAQGQLGAALDSYRAELAILDHLVKSDASNTEWQHSLAIAHNKIAGVEDTEGQFEQALDSYKAGLAIMERLAKSDPSNASWQYDLCISHNLVGALQAKHQEFDDALNSFQAGLAIAEHLVKLDPKNSDWQNLLSVSYQTVGVAQRLRLKLADALESYKAGLAIIERLAKSDPSNANWQDRLLLAHETVGEIESNQGQLAQALDSYLAALALADSLAKLDPSNTTRQFALATCYFGVGGVYMDQSNNAKAREMLEAGRTILAKLVALSPDNSDWKADLDNFDQRIAALKP